MIDLDPDFENQLKYRYCNERDAGIAYNKAVLSSYWFIVPLNHQNYDAIINDCEQHHAAATNGMALSITINEAETHALIKVAGVDNAFLAKGWVDSVQKFQYSEQDQMLAAWGS